MTGAPRASGLCEAKRPLPYGQRHASGRAVAARLLLLLIAAFLSTACTTNTGGKIGPSAPAEATGPAFQGADAVQPAADSSPLLATAPLPDLERLHGLSADNLRTMLGAPDFRRRDAAAEIWQYRGNGCILDLFLYRETGGYRVTYAEARDAGPLRRAPTGCLSTVVASRRSLHASNDTSDPAGFGL
jgi:hypothetical protein